MMALVQVIRELPAHTTLALLTISGSVSVYHLRGPSMAAAGSPGTNGGPHIVTADCFPGMRQLSCRITFRTHQPHFLCFSNLISTVPSFVGLRASSVLCIEKVEGFRCDYANAGHTVPSDAVLRGLFSRTQQYAVQVHSCRAVAHAVIQSLRCGSIIAHVSGASASEFCRMHNQKAVSTSAQLTALAGPAAILRHSAVRL